MPNKICLKSLLHITHAYQQLIVEGCTDHSPKAFTKWSMFCIVTTYTPTYVRITIPSRGEGLPVAHYADHEIFTGLWTICVDFGTDTECYYWCRNRVSAKLRELLFTMTAEGTYLTHNVRLK